MTASNHNWATWTPSPGASAPPFWRTQPERIVLAPRAGLVASERPPVRIFVGTEPAQARIERVFVWSVEQVRDPARQYEIYLMRELAGFDQRRWLTGFTNYRFAIPHLAGATGRAIYNDVDQVYLADPARLFDLDMGAHGFMSINDHDTSVMLIDCERLIQLWTLELAQRGKRKEIEAKARAVPSLWGPIDAGWNARDEEYDPGTSKCVHFTTIHTQPWMPFPERFVYQRNPIAHLFEELEQSADAAGFQLFSAANPSDEYRALVTQLAALGVELAALDASASDGRLELVPSQDVPWVLDQLFSGSGGHLSARVDTRAGTCALPGGTLLARRARPARWWREQLERAGQRRPQVHWELETVGERSRCKGGRRPQPPRIWVLEDDKTGHTVQSVGLAQALGWPYEIKKLEFNPLNRLSNHLLDASLISLASGAAGELTAPWPDLVITTGRKAAPIARWIARQSDGHTRLAHLGRKGGEVAENFDLVVSCTHFRMPQHRQRVEIAAPLNTLAPERLAQAGQRWQPLFAGAPHPWIVLVVGGSTAIHQLDTALATRIAGEVRAFAESAGGKVFAITSPRTGAAATEAVAQALGAAHHLHRWQPAEIDNPYFGFLALADAIVVTGESESMLSEACSVGAPVYIYAIPERAVGLRQRLREWVTQRAYSRKRKKHKGTVRPQQGIERVCAQLIARGLVRPPRDLTELHAALIRSGAAHRFGERLSAERHNGARDFDHVAERVRAMFGGAPGS